MGRPLCWPRSKKWSCSSYPLQDATVAGDTKETMRAVGFVGVAAAAAGVVAGVVGGVMLLGAE